MPCPAMGNTSSVAILTLAPQERLLQFFLHLQSSLKPLALLCAALESHGVLLACKHFEVRSAKGH